MTYNKGNRFISIYLLVAICLLSFCSSGVKKGGMVNDKIVIINSGRNFRLPIAKTISIINSLNPRVIALDMELKGGGFYGDSTLISTLNHCTNLVMVSGIDGYTGGELNYHELRGTTSEFLTNAKIGYTNVMLENDSFNTLKKFSIFERVNGLTMYHFAVRVAMSFDSLKTMSFIKDKPRVIDVEYRGDEKVFTTFSYEDVLQNKLTRNEIENKIVLIGFLEVHKGYKGPYDEDNFFSPLNNKKRPYKPDMHGVVYLANIVAQVLEDR